MENQVRVRFAPSPTGHLHIGGARTALYNFLYARHFGGKFILRIEDTDRERSTEAAVSGILEGLKWLGLNWDEGPFFQSVSLPAHEKALDELLKRGAAYRCYCSSAEIDEMRKIAEKSGQKPRYNGRCRDLKAPPAGKENVPPAIRFRTPHEGSVEFTDLIRGLIKFACAELDDLVIGRSDGGPTYNLSVVVDDIDSKITQVIRGDDHLNNTPRQILIYQALGATPPAFAHLPMILGADKKKLSKRHNEPSALIYRDMGYLPEALVNYLVRLGWSHGDEEVFSLERLIEVFDLSHMGSSAGAVNKDKLLWLNGHYIREAAGEKLWPLIKDILEKREDRAALSYPAPENCVKIIALLKDRSKTLVEIAESMVPFLRSSVAYDEKAVKKHLLAGIRPVLEKLISQLEALPTWQAGAFKPVFDELVAEQQIKLVQLAQPVRVSLTGTEVSPGIYEVLEILGKSVSIARLKHGLSLAV